MSMHSFSFSRCLPAWAVTAAACGVVAAGCFGVWLLSQSMPLPVRQPQPMLIAPMIGVIEPCILAQENELSTSLPGLAGACTGSQGSAAALVESTLSALHRPGGLPSVYPLGYTLPIPLLQLFRPTTQPEQNGWEIDPDRVSRLVRTVRDTERPVVLYLFSTHFATDAPIEKALAANPANLAQTRDGPLPQGRYYASPIYNWTFASTNTDLTQRRVQATQALAAEICRLPAKDLHKIQAVTLLGELHHLFPDFEQGMGFTGPYRVTDYSPASIAGFQRYLQTQWGSIHQLNRHLGSDYGSFAQVQPPSRDIRTEPLQRFTEHIDSFAHGSLPVSGWAFFQDRKESAMPLWVHVYRNGVFMAKTPVNQGRQDVLQAHPEWGTANTGWRLDLDFRQWPAGMHRIDVFVEHKPGQLTALATRHIVIMDRLQSTPALVPQAPLPVSAPMSKEVQTHVDLPANQSSYYYNPLVPLWHAYRAQQVVDYLRFFNASLDATCLVDIPHYTHQIMPFTNPSWDANKFAIQASLKPLATIRLGVSLYGDATYGPGFFQWRAASQHARYGVTEFHPLKPMGAQAMQAMLAQHASQGADFLSFFLEPRWQGTAVPRGHNLFSWDPQNRQFGSDVLYHSIQDVLNRPALPQ